MKMNFTELALHLSEGKLDLDKVRQYLQCIPHTTIDPIKPFPNMESYMICGYPGYVTSCVEKRKKGDPGIIPWGCTVIHLYTSASDIGVGFYGNDEDPRFIEASKFVLWLLSQYDCEITDDEGRDWTEKVKQQGPEVLFQ